MKNEIPNKNVALMIKELLQLCAQYVPIEDLASFSHKLDLITHKHVELNIIFVRGKRYEDISNHQQDSTELNEQSVVE